MLSINITRPICREKLNSQDRAFISTTLSRDDTSSSFCDNLLDDPKCLDKVLDHPRLLGALLESPEVICVSEYLYFYVLVRAVFQRTNLNERAVADYVATLLAEYILLCKANELNTAGRQNIFYAVDIFQRIADAGFCERFILTVQLADHSLFITGIFRNHIEEREKRRAAPQLQYYESIGQSHYRVAEDHHLAQEYELAQIYKILANRFLDIRRALNRLAENLIFMDRHSSLNWPNESFS